MITVITGPMFASKSKRLIQYLTGAMTRNIPAVALKPQQDHRNNSASIYSYDGSAFPALVLPRHSTLCAVESVVEAQLGDGKHLMAVDEVQFLNEEIVSHLFEAYHDSSSWLLLGGLSHDSDGNPFGPLPDFLAHRGNGLGVHVEHLTARCSFCHGVATMTHCKVEKNGPVLVGRDIYEPRCRPCWEFGNS